MQYVQEFGPAQYQGICYWRTGYSILMQLFHTIVFIPNCCKQSSQQNCPLWDRKQSRTQYQEISFLAKLLKRGQDFIRNTNAHNFSMFELAVSSTLISRKSLVTPIHFRCTSLETQITTIKNTLRVHKQHYVRQKYVDQRMELK